MRTVLLALSVLFSACNLFAAERITPNQIDFRTQLGGTSFFDVTFPAAPDQQSVSAVRAFVSALYDGADTAVELDGNRAVLIVESGAATPPFLKMTTGAQLAGEYLFEITFATTPTGSMRDRVGPALRKYCKRQAAVEADEQVEVEHVWTDLSHPSKRSKTQPVKVYITGGRFEFAKG